MLEEIENLVAKKIDFGFETTLSGRTYLKLIGSVRRLGYKVTIYFLWAPTVEVTGLRVKERVLKGGHNIPEADQNRRFARTVRNFLIDYRHSSDAWLLFDNSGLEPVPIAEQEQGETRIIKPEIYKELMEQYGQPE